ncbi:MAG: DUF1385 domain-containing protein, partial [Clostridia bacterium]|nr:DUF1385 domain-containing protein [Clostridia bacterium]
LLLIPVIAGLSYELLQWTGRHDNSCVKALSMPGICLQLLTTKEPDDEMLRAALAAYRLAAEETEKIEEKPARRIPAFRRRLSAE